jgi:hypothetical protein
VLHPNSIAQQGAVGWIVNVGFHDRRIHAHPPPRDHAFSESNFYDPLMNLLEHLRPERRAPAAHRLGIGHLASAHAGKVPVHQIGPHLPFKRLVAPVADMLEDQQPQHRLGRCATATAAAALGMSLPHGLIHNRDNLFVRQHLIGMRHPAFAKIVHFLRDQPVAETQLLSPHLNHAAASDVSAQPVLGAAGHD